MEVDAVSGGYRAQMAAMQSMRRPQGPPSAEQAEKMSDKIMSDRDQDGDGLLNSSELGFSDELFTNMDSDGDGSVSSSELQSGLGDNWEQFGSELMARMKASGFQPPQGAGGPQGMGGKGGNPADTLMAEADEDGDGGLSADELGFSSESFDALDTNEDGIVSAEELQAGLSAEGGREQYGEEVKARMNSLGHAPPQQDAQMKQGMAAYGKQLDLAAQFMDDMTTTGDAASFRSGYDFGTSFDEAV